ncbi:MAG: ATP-binding protein [Opitutus sp.]
MAARCQALSDPEEIKVLWWLQQISWREGGLERFVCEFLEKSRSKIGTRSMLRFGCDPAQVYTADQVKAVRHELNRELRFPLKGERDLDYEHTVNTCVFFDRSLDQVDHTKDRSQRFPCSYTAADFRAECLLQLSGLAKELKVALVDPASPSLRSGLACFAEMWEALNNYRREEISAAVGKIVPTAVTRQLNDELDFALETRSFVLIEGREGIGKTEGARSWCAQHVGQAVYVRLEAGSDETTLFRSISRALGTACSYQRKAVEMRARIQDALQPGHLLLVLDEAHFLWPQWGRAERSVPKRMDWLRTALVDFGVPVALISTPQYFSEQCERHRKAGWNANQVQRRIVRTTVLPETVSNEDAVSVGRSYFPEVSLRLLKLAASAALLDVSRLTMFSHLRKRVDFLSSRRPELSRAQLLELALVEIEAPGMASDKADAQPLQTSRTAPAKPVLKAPNRVSSSTPQFELNPV